MNSSRQNDGNSTYGYAGDNNYNGGYGNSNQYSIGAPSNGAPMIIPGNPYYTSSNLDKAYSIVNTEPVMVTKERAIILVDPILEPHVKSYMTWSIINVFFCCCLGGLITTVLSCNVMRLNDDKKYKEAYKLSRYVVIGNMIASGVGALVFLIVFPYIYMAIYPYLPKINY